MFDLILQISMVISLSAIVYLLARAVPRVSDDVGTEESYIDRWLSNIPVGKIDVWFSMLLAKFLRRLRVIVLKIDNLLHRSIASVNHNHKHSEKKTLIEDLHKMEK